MSELERVNAAQGRVRLMRAFDARAHSDESAKHTGDESLVQQQFGNEVDINTIVRRFSLTGQALPVLEGGIYGDFTDITDFEGAAERVVRAEREFMRLPAATREKFNNSSVEFMQYASSVPEATLFKELGLSPVGAWPPVEPGAPAPAPAPAPVGP